MAPKNTNTQNELELMRASDQKAVDEVFRNEGFRCKELLRLQTPLKESAEDDTEANKYVVFIGYDDMVDWAASGTYSNEKSPERQKLLTQAENLNGRPCRHLPDEEHMTFKRMVGQTIVAALDGDPSAAEAQCQAALEYYVNRTAEVFRYRQILCTTILYALLFIALLILLHAAIKHHPCTPPLLLYMLMASLAGSFYSIARKSGEKQGDASCGWKLQIWDTLLRGGLAIMLGGIAWGGLQSGIAPQALQNLQDDHFAFIALAFVAGMTDSFIPSLITQSISTKL